MKYSKAVIVALFAVTLLAACATAAGPERDAWVEDQIEARIANDVSLQGTNIGVEVENGEVLLTGNVFEKAQKTKAISLAGSVQFVTSVTDRLELTM